MAVHYKVTGFIFKKEDQLEADRVFSVFTREFGRLEITGRAIRKIASKLRGGAELFYVSDIEFVQGKTKKTLTDAVAIEKYESIYHSPEKMELAGKMAALIDQFIVGEQKDEHLLDLILQAFSILDKNPPRQLIYFYFFWNFAAALGYGPDLKKMPPSVAGVVSLIIKKNWEELALLKLLPKEQKLLIETSANYHSYLLDQVGRRNTYE